MAHPSFLISATPALPQPGQAAGWGRLIGASGPLAGAELAAAIGLTVPASCRMLFGPTPADHPFVQAEQMMPVMPVVRVRDFDEAVALGPEEGA